MYEYNFMGKNVVTNGYMELCTNYTYGDYRSKGQRNLLPILTRGKEVIKMLDCTYIDLSRLCVVL